MSRAIRITASRLCEHVVRSTTGKGRPCLWRLKHSGENRELSRVTVGKLLQFWYDLQQSNPELEGYRGKSGHGPRGADSSKCNS
jgi:hypothetical protein